MIVIATWDSKIEKQRRVKRYSVYVNIFAPSAKSIIVYLLGLSWYVSFLGSVTAQF